MKLRWPAALALLLVLPGPLQARWFQDTIVFQIKDAGNVTFSHDKHLQAVGRNCQRCHNEIFQIVHARNHPATMTEMEKGASCGVCHNGEKAFSVKENCENCHAM